MLVQLFAQNSLQWLWMKNYFVGAILLIIAIILGASIWYSRANTKPPMSVQSEGRYVALGDSVAAGAGLETYSDSSACSRTKESYSNEVAAKLKYHLDSVACSGAATDQGLMGSQDVNQLALPPQIDAAVSGDKPKLITLTIGANDAGWMKYVQKCYVNTCGSAADTAQVNAGVNTAVTNVDKALRQIKTTYPDDTPHVIITGYYTLFPISPSALCLEATGINQAELAWIAQLQNNVNESLKSATLKYPFVSYIPISFAGHELCSKDPWIQGLNSKAPYHPNDEGQLAIASQILAFLKLKK